MAEEKKQKSNKILHISICAFIVVLIAAIVILIMFKYEVEGEKNLPFNLSKMIVISTAEGVSKEQSENRWDYDIHQNNDIYISLIKNENYKENEIIKKVTLENFAYKTSPQKGNISIYKPASEGLYKYEEQYLITDKIEYIGGKQTNVNNLEIANQGGVILLRFSNNNLAEYKSNDDMEIQNDGTLLAKTGITNEEIKYTVSFDIIIETGKNIKYKANMSIDLPVGNMLEEGTSNLEKTDFSDIIFKRE